MNKLSQLILLLIGGCVLVPSTGFAQPPDPDDYRRFFRKPVTPAEFWNAIKFERDVGRFDLAAKLIAELLKSKPDNDQLIKLHEADGITPFLRLKLISKWYSLDDLTAAERMNKAEAQKTIDKLNDQARKDAALLIQKIVDAVNAKRTDPERIKLFAKNLTRSKEERQYALQELDKAGPIAIPYLLQELQSRPPTERAPILEAMSLLGIDTVPPLLAALDNPDADLRGNIITVLRNRRDFTLLAKKGMDPKPFLWPLTSRFERSSYVKGLAKEALAVLYEVHQDRLPLAQVELTREAERYYQHQVRFPATGTVTVWRWLGGKLVTNTDFTIDQAEKYYALRFAGQAMKIDPEYKPAQLVFLLTTLDKGYVVTKPKEHPLGEPKPKVKDLLASLSPEIVLSALARGARDDNPRVILAAIESLGYKKVIQAGQPTVDGHSPLVRALYSGDRRIQMAAVEALLKIPGQQSLKVKSRMLEILRRAIAGKMMTKTRPRVLVAVKSRTWRQELKEKLSKLGYEPIVAERERDALRRAQNASDLDLILLDSTLPRGGVSAMLGQLRVGADTKRLPIILAAIPATPRAEQLLTKIAEAQLEIKHLLEIKASNAAKQELDVLNVRVRESLMEKKGRFELAREKRIEELQQYITRLDKAYEHEVDLRQRQLEEITASHRNLMVLDPAVIEDEEILQSRMATLFQEAGMPPLTAAEQKEQAENALKWIGKMAEGEIKAFDLSALKEELLAMLTSGGINEAGQKAAIDALGTLSGLSVQRKLAEIILDEKRSPGVRLQASEKLQEHFQKHGAPQAIYRLRLVDALTTATRQPKLDGKLKAQMERLIADLNRSPARTGGVLGNYVPDLPPAKP